MIHIMRIDEMAMKGSLLAQYDEVDRFSDEYLKVTKDGKYNLIDFDGNLLGKIWFDSIEQKKDGTFDVSFTDNRNETHSGNYNLDETPVSDTSFSKSHIKELNPILVDIDLSDIVILYDPYTIKDSVTEAPVKIVAIVTYKGQEFQLGEDGELYDYDNKPYSMNDTDGDWTQKYTIPQLKNGYDNKTKPIMDFCKKYDSEQEGMCESIASTVKEYISTLNRDDDVVNIDNFYFNFSHTLEELLYDVRNGRLDATTNLLEFGVTFDVKSLYKDGYNNTLESKKRFMSDNFVSLNVKRDNFEMWANDETEWESSYLTNEEIYDAPFMRISLKWKKLTNIMPLDDEIENVCVSLLKEGIKKIYDHYNSLLDQGGKDKASLINNLMNELDANNDKFPMFARFYDFGNGEKLYIMFGNDLWKDGDDSDWTLTDDDIDNLRKYCGCSITDVDNIDYEELYDNGLELSDLKLEANDYLADRPVIKKAIKGLTATEYDRKYRTEETRDFESNLAHFNYLTNIVEYNDIFDYERGYFIKCFGEIDEVLGKNRKGNIVNALGKIRNNPLLIRSIDDLANNFGSGRYIR